MKRILLVEDDRTLLEVLSIALKTKGYVVNVAIDGLEAINKINENLPDLIILDVNLPKLSGFDVAKAIKENDKTKHIPIIMLTALGQDVNIKRGYETGCEDYITKPFNLEHLCLKIQKYIK